MPDERESGVLMQDSRIDNARLLLLDALKTGDHTYMRALIVEAQKVLATVVDEF